MGSKTVCILYGLCEGPKVAKRFRAKLRAHGYSIIADPAKADIIIGHSGGCYLVPEHMRAERIIQIGLPYWPGRPLIASIWHKLLTDITNHHRNGALRFWAHKTFWNVVYFWNMPANIRMMRGRSRGDLWRHGRITTVVRPVLDSFCTPNLQVLPFAGKPGFTSIPGNHDDCWRDPDPYIDIIVK